MAEVARVTENRKSLDMGSGGGLPALTPMPDNVWRLFPSDTATPAIDRDLEPLVQMVTASRSRVIARLVTLRLMSGKNPLRERFESLTVRVAQKALLAEEELVEAVVRDLELPLHSGPIYCSVHKRLEFLGRSLVPRGYRAGIGSSWELLHSEIILSVNECAAHAMSVFSQASNRFLDLKRLGQLYCDALEAPVGKQESE